MQRALPAWMALLCYFFVGAIVPPGHMAAALAGGTPFHLCPGDLRSAQLIDALSAVAETATASMAMPEPAHHHHHHHHQPQGHHQHHNPDADSAGPALEKSSADPGCSFAGSGSASPATALDVPITESGETLLTITGPRLDLPARRWLRPPTRSPTA